MRALDDALAACIGDAADVIGFGSGEPAACGAAPAVRLEPVCTADAPPYDALAELPVID